MYIYIYISFYGKLQDQIMIIIEINSSITILLSYNVHSII